MTTCAHVRCLVVAVLVPAAVGCGGVPSDEGMSIGHSSAASTEWLGGWLDTRNMPPFLTADPVTPTNTVQRVNRATGGGDYFSPFTPVIAGQTYCVHAKVLWLSGAAPFVGIERWASATRVTTNWLIGRNWNDPMGRITPVSTTETGWQTIERAIVMPTGTTQIKLVTELWAGGAKDAGVPLAYFDEVTIALGGCGTSVAGRTVPYNQQWESGADGWLGRDGTPPTIVTGTGSPGGGSAQQIARATSGGDFRSPVIDVSAGTTYCVGSQIQWVGGAVPFVGIERYDANGVLTASNWLIGRNYRDALGPVTQVSETNTGWQTLRRQFAMPAGTARVRLVNQAWNGYAKAGTTLSNFDNLSINSGECGLLETTAIPYNQNWEQGAGGWVDGRGVEPELLLDTSSTAGTTVHKISRTAGGGDFLSPLMPVTAGNTYCLSTHVRWVSGGAPFVGIVRYDSTGTSVGSNWLIGNRFTDALGPMTTASETQTGWQNLMRTFVMPAGTAQIKLMTELYAPSAKDTGSPLAYFDGFSMTNGACTESCTDTVLNGTETGVDCGGGSCGPCADGQACTVNADCVSLACRAGVCISQPVAAN